MGDSQNKEIHERRESGDLLQSGGDAFRIIGIGASAGGLAAIESLIKAMPPEPGVAFVLVTHLSPDRPSLLPELLQKTTTLQVCQIEDGVVVQPNHLYTSVPNREVAIRDGILQTLAMTQPHGQQLPIDFFFESLAKDQGSNAGAIVLSGAAHDGTEGVRAIKAAGGLVIAQDPESAEFDSMPRSAIQTQAVDYVLLPEDMPSQLVLNSVGSPRFPAVQWGEVALQSIFTLLRARTNHDFSRYKHNTICRRLERRMHVHQFEKLDDYIRYVRESDRETEILFNDLLIGVTSFFRDPAVFDVLKSNIAPMISGRSAEASLRVWIAGCATGEEAYSVAILMHECMEEALHHCHVQIFATDLDESAIGFARVACYSANMIAGLNEQRLERYFTKTQHGDFVVKRVIREMVVFAPQNVIADPPFTNLDLLCCRNMLIYFQPELQQELLSTFQYSLKPDGLLLLGPAETIGRKTDQFTSLDKQARLYRRLESHAKIVSRSAMSTMSTMSAKPGTVDDSTAVQVADEYRALHYVEAILEKTSMPPCVIVDHDFNIVYVHGHTGQFLQPASGKISVNVLDMSRPGLRAPLATALRQISIDHKNISCGNVEIGFKEDPIRVAVKLSSVLQHSPLSGMVLIQFEEASSNSTTAVTAKKTSHLTNGSVEELQEELRDCRENLETISEEMQASNEELTASNEELQSTNEELQSTNEELETSKEELQSLNEESASVNAELQSRVNELSKISDDLKNLLDSTDIATVFLDAELQIRSFTPRAVDLIPLSESDKGRSINDLSTRLQNLDPNLGEFAAPVLEDLVVREMEVKSSQHRTYLLRARPYRTTANMIDGVVLTFENVTRLKQAEQLVSELAVQSSEEKLLTVMRVCKDGILLADRYGTLTGVNAAFCNLLGYSESELIGRSVNEFLDSDSIEVADANLRKARRANYQLPPEIIEKCYVKRNGSTVRGRETITWHIDSRDSKPLYSIAFVQPMANTDVEIR